MADKMIRTDGLYSTCTIVVTLNMSLYFTVPGDVELLEVDDAGPVEEFTIEWKGLKVKPNGYTLELYRGKDLQISHSIGFQIRTFNFGRELVHPGMPYFCKVWAYNKSGPGKPAISRNYLIGKHCDKLF